MGPPGPEFPGQKVDHRQIGERPASRAVIASGSPSTDSARSAV